ncbi:MAG: uncharacterized metal-binding protein YceD (DUF177 family) [Flavobacteriales bacterium]
MKLTNDYTIPFTGLTIGKHAFEFQLGKAFFEQFEYSEISEGDVFIDVILEKQSSMMILDFEFEGVIETICDRCQESVEIELEGEFRLIVKFGDYTDTNNDEILILGPNEVEVDFTQYFYEYSHLALPSKRVHDSLEECNQDVIAILKNLKSESGDDVDPRWGALKDI